MQRWQTGDQLFVFGSLIDTEILTLVTNMSLDDLSLIEASVSGYRCSEIVEDTCPVLVVVEHASAKGMLLSGLTDDAMRRIVFF